MAFFVEPLLRSLPESVQVVAAPKFAARLGKIMPFWYAATLLLTLASLWLSHSAGKHLLAAASAGLQALIILATVTLLVPINNRLARMTSAYDSWQQDAHRWDTLHAWRVVMLAVATILLVSA